MEKPRRMSPGAEEIYEVSDSSDELDLVYHSKGLNPVRCRRRGNGRCGTAPHCDEDELSQLIEMLDRESSRIRDSQQKGKNSFSWKNAQKRPIGHSGAGTSESSVTLKQALRRSCISHASEAAAMKRLSKPTGSSDFSEAGNIKRLYATVIGQADRPLAEEKRSLLEIKTKSGRTALEASEQEAAASSRLHDLEACGRTADPLPQVSSAGPPRKVTRPSFQHVISLASKEAGIKPSAHLGKMSRGEPGPGPSIAISKPRGAELKKPHASPRPVRPTYVGKNTSKKKSTPEVVGSSEREAYSRSKMVYYGECTAASSAGAHNAAVSSRKGDYDEAMPGSTRRGDSCMGFEGKVRIGQRSREKGERSQSSKSSVGDYSTSTSISDESNQSISSGNGCKPHMSRDLRWTAIRHVEMNQGCIRLNNFKLLKRLGCGDIGTVYVAELVGSGCLFALKVMDNDFLLSRKKMPRAQTEREILQILDHPFLPTLYTYFTTDNLSCLVMEYCPGGDLHVLRQKQPWRSFSEPAARFYVAEVLLALEYLHMLGVIYRDLKPENILVREDGHIMLSDFDLSLRCSVTPVLLRSPLSGNAEAEETPSNFSCVDPLCLDPPCAKVSCLTPRLVPLSAARSKDQAAALPQLVAEPTEARSNSFVGTHEYLAPEIIKGEGHGSSVDWWTLGIFLYELLFGRTPFKGASDEETLMNIVTQDLCYPESPAVTVPAKELIRGLLVKDPERRLGSIRGATEIKRHPFFEGLNWALIRCTIPPETPAPDELLLPPPPPPAPAPAVVSRKKPARCLDFGNGEKVEFELF